ncbi:Crp/Fnr family transcriptional regulator [Pedobacter frigidisoli]|uniref:Crp/Fnr family transcriptional regulator n=1 Tax=Pedobacter frigidisoli TaxID=2530455 RepID=UPI002930A148|nr:Crp/Fnr family transcriptional regulator [Pedobacter frigidisoli]
MENVSPVLDYIQRYISLNEDEQQFLSSFLQIKKIRKKQHLVQPGFVCTHKSYVVKGALRAYLVDREGKEHTLAFAIEDWWVSDYSSLIYQQPATLFVEALEDCSLIQISYASEQELFDKIPQLEKFERIITQRSLAFQHKRLLENFTHTAEERYDEFLRKYPEIVRRVPQYALASYLGFSTEYLSKIRNRKAGKS